MPSTQAKGRQYYDGDVNLPAFLTAKNLKPFIPKGLEVTSSQVEFRPLRGARAYGYPAELMAQLDLVSIPTTAIQTLRLNRGQHAHQECPFLLRFLFPGIENENDLPSTLALGYSPRLSQLKPLEESQ